MSATLVHGQGSRVGFYATTCPRAESIVSSTVATHFRSNTAIAPALLRMHFHDCFVRGCDASVLIDGSNTEKTAPPNLGLRGYEVTDDAKTQLEAACPGIVSCADILALAARDSVVLLLKFHADWWTKLARPTGRRDGRVSLASETTDLPGFRESIDSQKQKFSAKVLTHKILYLLNGDGTKRVAFDTGSENRFDASFFANLRNGRGILESDQKLWTDASTRAIVQRFLGITGLAAFNVEFGRSMVKMSNTGVKTGTDGEIRKICSAVNS
ncbi:hypothetical protein GH714_030562 [Hevea brasiliensis]|uniref:peroxidase n=1 Tax=Hevea brasiliensis TaxID=3981 RepID=A0A6A6L292_HEVBR|nr:hypothetical protein GH714_030562 [Hevea brasiliensis]